jgi:hypothetical protein
MKYVFKLWRNREQLFALIRPNTKIKKKIYIIIRNDDFSALSNPSKERKILKIFEKYNIPQVVGTVPYVTEGIQNAHSNRYHLLQENNDIVSLIKEYQKKGLIDIAQHGFTHQTNICHPDKYNEITKFDCLPGADRQLPSYAPLNPEGYSEFRHLPFEIQKAKISIGKQYLQKVFNARIETFIAPWNSVDGKTLQALKELGFSNVLCGKRVHNTKKINVVSCLHEDIFKLPIIIDGTSKEDQPILVHILYHSWMLNERGIKKLDKMLSTLRLNENLRFITSAQLKEVFPQISSVLNLSTLICALKKEAKSFSYYVLNTDFYKKIIFSILGVMLLKKIRTSRVILLIGLLLFVLLLYKLT